MIRSNEIRSCGRGADFRFEVAIIGVAGARQEQELELELGMEKWGLLLPGAPEPRLTLLRRQGFRSVFQTALRSLSNRSIVVVCNYGLAR
jgi:hypothetical protein